MTDTPIQLAKREMQQFFQQKTAWVSAIAAGMLLGLIGPFETGELMRLLPRLTYWVFVAVTTYLIGSIVEAVLRSLLSKHLPFWGTIVLAALVSSVLITCLILALNVLVFAFFPDFTELAALWGNVFLASAIVTGAIGIISSGTNTEDKADSTIERLQQRLPVGKRGTLISLSAVDHYVEITTTKGRELVLMRLSDAIAETHANSGLQIHRSHWVALDQVLDVERAQGKATVRTSDGRDLPVSRSNLSALKEAGLLPA